MGADCEEAGAVNTGVMPALGAGISLRWAPCSPKRDRRVKPWDEPGHDDRKSYYFSLSTAAAFLATSGGVA
jgi:hypothetical protein